MTRWPSPLYEITTIFHTPLPLAFRWCTDFSPADPGLAGFTSQRKPVKKTARQIVFEDLSDEPKGWDWTRWVATLHPPDRWHVEGKGNRGDWTIDYRLTALDDERTELAIRGRRRPTAIGPANPRKAGLERDMGVMWKTYGRVLERDPRRRPRRRR